MNSYLQEFLTGSGQFLQAPIFRVGEEPISILWLLKLLLSFLTVLLLSILSKRLLKNRLLPRLGASQGQREAISTLVTYGIGALGFVIILQVNGLNIAPLVVTLGGLGIGVGFGFQEITKNLISGLTLLIEGKLRVGDYVEFDNLSGHIKEIALRSTVIRTFDGGDVVVPNSNLTSNRVLNWSYESLTGKLHIPVKVAYNSDPLLVTEALLNSAYMESTVLHEPPPRAIFKGFGESALEFELWVWIAQIDEGLLVKSSLNFIVEFNLRQAGIKIPLPQRDLWLRNIDELKQIIPQLQDSQPSSNGKTSNNSINLNPQQSLANSLRQSISIRDSLRQLPHFNICSDIHLRELIETGYRKFFTESEVVFSEKEMGSHFYLVLSGSIETMVTRLNQHVKIYKSGDILGEVAIMLNLPYTSTAQALEDTSVFVINKHSFCRLLRLHPDLAETFTQELTKEKKIYQDIRQQLEELGLLGMTEHNNRFADWVKLRLKGIFSA
ncbi:MAG: mechanosensitive ion channel protein MscS [Pseudanabaena sp.]|nr:MAG: mechanosensitive ion channel protein MscS [Pseudanabaena sp.]